MPVSENIDALQQNPRIWVLYGARTGDNQQIKALATSLGWTVEEKFLDYLPLYIIPNFLMGVSRYTVKKSARAQLCPPWPDIVIGSGRRSVAPARWIKQQSGNRTKLVQLGRPRAPLHLFDLVITTTQYGLPKADNILSITLPLLSQIDANVESSESVFAGLSNLPRPWTGILIGGTTWPFIMDSQAAATLARDINHWIGKFGGSALITTSPRSDANVVELLEEYLDVPHFVHRWVKGNSNPYKAILQSADQMIVTSDSVSMLADAYRSGKPTAIWKAGIRTDPLSLCCRALGNQAVLNTGIGRLLRSAALKGLFTPPRHVERLTNAIIASKRASWFNSNSAIKPLAANSEDDDMALAIDRVHSLFD